MHRAGQIFKFFAGEALRIPGERLASARAGSGRCLLLQGGPGLGKSSLATSAGELGRAESMTVLRARGSDDGAVTDLVHDAGAALQRDHGRLRPGQRDGGEARGEPVLEGAEGRGGHGGGRDAPAQDQGQGVVPAHGP